MWYVNDSGQLNSSTQYEEEAGVRPALYLNPDISVSGDTIINSDATLATVLSQSISAGSQAGTTTAPIQATIYVTNTVATVAASDIVATESNNATVTFYGTDSTFTTPASGSVNLTQGGETNVYVKVVSQDGSATLYYEVMINRANASLATVLGQSISAGSQAGTTTAPIQATISVANSVATVESSDITAAANASVTFYGTDSTFTTPASGSVNLTEGGETDVYVKVVSQDGSATLYYEVMIDRVGSSDASLVTVLGQSITTGSQTGQYTHPKQATISVANSVATVESSDITAAANATVTFYGTNSTFGTPASGSVNLTEGAATDVYVMVRPQDGSNPVFYEVIINRAAAPSNGVSISTGSGPYTAPLAVTINDSGLSVGQSVYYSTAGDPESVSGAIYASPLPFSFSLSISSTVYAQVYDSSTGWGSPTSDTYTISQAVNKAALDTAITSDNTLIGSVQVGSAAGDVPQAAYDAFQSAINTATTVAQDSTATQAAVDAQVTALATAATAFDNALITAPATVHVTDVSMNEPTDTITAGGYDQLTATIAPSNAADQATTWSSDNTGVATVNASGLVTAIAAGTAHITVTNATLTTTPTVSGGNATATLPQITTISTTSDGNVDVSITNGTQVTGPSNWNGTINLPQVVNNVTMPSSSGNTTTVNEAIEIGLGDTALNFNPPVQIRLAGQRGKDAGWIRNGIFTAITYQMASDSASALNGHLDGYITVGNDLVIWTTHFTTFVAYTETAVNPGGGGGGGGGGSSTPALAITTTSLTTGTIGQPYNQTISTNDEGTAPYTFAVTSGSLPGGLVLDASTGVISGMPTAAGTYTFTVTVKDANNNSVSENYTVTVNAAVVTPPIRPALPAVTLSDIPGNWAQANIEKLVALGAITGYQGGTFRPNQDVTRAEFATVLVKALKLAPKTGPVFSDTQGTWAQRYISTAAAYGIVSGYDATHFGPNDLITREQMTAMVVRAAKLAPVTGDLSFKDAPTIDSWAREDVITALKDGIINGYPPPTFGGYPTFRPLAYATRAEAVTVIAGLLK